MAFNFFPKLAVLALAVAQSATAFSILSKTLVFDETTDIADFYGSNYRTHYYQFTLENPAVLTFSSTSKRICFDFYKDSEHLVAVDKVCDDFSFPDFSKVLILEAKDYYLFIHEDSQGSDVFSVDVEINAKEIPQESFYIVEDISLPFSAGLYFHPDFNSRFAGDGYLEKVFELKLGKETEITYAKGCGSGLNVYKDASLTQFAFPDTINPCVFWKKTNFTLPEGTYYLVFDDKHSYSDLGDYAGVFVQLEVPNVVTVTLKDGSAMTSQTIAEGTRLKKSVIPERAGFIAEWYWEEHEEIFDITDLIFENMTLTATWRPALISISTTELPNGETTKVYSEKVLASVEQNVGGAVTFTLIGDLPNGLTFNPDGTISGMPTEVGSSTFTIKATHDNGLTAEKEFTISISVASSIRTPQIAANGLKAYTLGNSIMLQNLPKNAKVQVYNLSGKLVSSKSLNQVNQGSDMSFDVQTKGMYIVKVGKQTLRVVVR